MIPTHHPPEEWLLAHVAGSLTEPLHLLVASHATLCPICREHLRDIEEAAGAALDDGPAAPLSPGAFRAVLERLGDQEARPEPPPLRSNTALPRPLLDYLPEGDLPWRFLAPGIQQIPLPLEQGEMPVRLIRLAPKLRVPYHTHAGLERTLVLQGGYSDETGDFVRGDVGVRDGSGSHDQRIHDGDPCIALVIADAPLVPVGLLSTVLSWFIRA